MLERLERLDQMFAGMQRLEQLMMQVLERLERSERSQDEATQRADNQPVKSEAADPPALPRNRAGVIARIRHTRDVEHKQFQQIADELNAAGIATFSGRGQWSKANVRRFYQPT
jgi:hypothetical protein